MFTDRLFPTSRANECPVCGNTTGKCRTKDNEEQAVLCGGTPGARKLDREGLYICVNDNAKGHTTHTWILAKDDNWDDAAKARYHLEKCHRLELIVKAKQAALEKELGLPDRDKHHRAIQSQLSLSSAHRKNLLDRGLSDEQINSIGFVSVGKFQKLKGSFPDNLPGYNYHLKNLTNYSEGILIPIFHEDRIAAFKIRLDEANNGQRYTSVSSQKYTSFHLYGESPLAVLHGDKSKGLWLAEGELKPLVANQKFNIAILGGAKYWQNSPNHCSKFLSRMKEIYGNRLNISLDAGDILNQQVMNQIIAEYKFFEFQGFDCYFAWWGQANKESNDIDELDNLDNIEFVKLERIEELIAENKKESISNWAWEQWLKSRKFTPDIIMNDRYFEFPKLPENNAMISVLASLGKGKTEAIIRMILASGNGIHIIGYRNNLLSQTIARAKENGLDIFHINDDSQLDYLLDKFNSINKWAYCLDSAYKLEGYFVDRDIILDESCSVLIHALNGGTLGDNQAKAIRVLSTALKECNRVFLLDGNNSDLYTNFYHSLCPEKKLIRIKNTHGSPKHNIKIIDAISDGEIKSRNRTPLTEMMLDKEVVPWIYCDSKERTKVIHQMFVDNNKRGYCLNSETAGDEWAKEFLADPDNFILDKKPDYIILSPTAESGISVSLRGYFTDKFTFFAGVTGTNGQVQAMFRLRDESINHYVFCPEQSMAKDRYSPHTYSIKQYQNILNNRILQSSLMASESANNPNRALELMGAAIARTRDDWWEMSAKLGVVDNYEMNNLRKCLIYALEEAGHNVEIVQKEANEELKKAESEAKITVQKTYAKEVHAANEFSTVEEAQKAAKSNPRKDTQRRIEKTFFLDRLPDIKDSSLWGEDFIYEVHIKKKEYIRNIERYWFVNNFDVSQKRHEAKWFYEATKEDFFSARVSRMTHSVIWALRELDIMKFTNPYRSCDYLGIASDVSLSPELRYRALIAMQESKIGDAIEYHKNSPSVVSRIQKLRDSKDIRIALKMESMPPATESRDENMGIISSLLGMIGFKNKSQGKKFVENIRLRHYQALPVGFEDELEEGEFDFIAAREAILISIGKKFSTWMESEKAVIDWEEVIASEEPVAILLSDEEARDYMIPLIVEQFQSVTSIEECRELNESITKEQKIAAWWALTQDVRDRIRGLFNEVKC